MTVVGKMLLLQRFCSCVMTCYVSCMTSPIKPVICVTACMHVVEGFHVQIKKQRSRSNGDDSSMQACEASAMDDAE